MATILNIDEKIDLHFSEPGSLSHFAFHVGAEIDPEIVIQQDTISPYCLDHESRQMIFAELPPEIDLTTVPFVYQAQQKHAIRLIAVSYDVLPDLVKKIDYPEKMIAIYSTGRAGSTLMNQILNEIEGVVSFSEPDVFLNLVHIAPSMTDRDELKNLVTYAITLLTYAYADKIVAIKHRAECIDIVDVLYEAFPNTKNLFLYRHIMDWTASWRRILLLDGMPDDIPIDAARAINRQLVGRTDHIDSLLPENVPSVKSSVLLVLLWMFYVDAYLSADEKGIPFLTIQYQTLNQHRREALAHIFEHVGITADLLDQAMRGFESDSQAGTDLQRAEAKGNTQKLDAENRQLVTDMLAKHPRKFQPDIILPATLML